MLDDVVATYGSRLFIAVGGVALALICLFFVLRFIRNRAPSPFVRGGRNRQPRLQVLDAAAVDARRRLVLVRRDGIEHLILIGGPTDIVVESGIDPNRESAATPAASFEALSSSEPLPFARPEPVRETPPRREPQPTATVREPVTRQQPQPQPAPPRPEPAAADPDIYTPAVAVLDTPQRPAHAPEPQRLQRNVEDLYPTPIPTQAAVPVVQVPDVIVPESPAAAEAANVLDAVRDRVLPPQPVRPAPSPQVITPPAQSLPVADHGTPVTPRDSNILPISPMASAGPAVDIQPQLREPATDFQSVLDDEMSNGLTAERITPNAPGPMQPQRPGQGPRREPELPPITGADSALQKEVARIFGEMSVNRDK